MPNFRAPVFIKSSTSSTPTTNIHASGNFLDLTGDTTLAHKQQQNICVTCKKVSQTSSLISWNVGSCNAGWSVSKSLWDLNMSSRRIWKHLLVHLSLTALVTLTLYLSSSTLFLPAPSSLCLLPNHCPSAPLWKPPEDLLLKKHCCWLYTHSLGQLPQMPE